MKKISRLQVTAWVLSLLPAAMTAVFYSRLPAEIPMQWDLAGHMNYETRWHLWIVAGMAPLFAVLFYFLPRFDILTVEQINFYIPTSGDLIGLTHIAGKSPVYVCLQQLF